MMTFPTRGPHLTQGPRLHRTLLPKHMGDLEARLVLGLLYANKAPKLQALLHLLPFWILRQLEGQTQVLCREEWFLLNE